MIPLPTIDVSHGVVFCVLPGCTVHVPPWFAVTVPDTVNVPVPAFAVTVPDIGCVTCDPSTISLAALVHWTGEMLPLVIVVGEVLN